jgi:crotonobetainyl-CoA:carnitine CoA-transferase CaiB-like acyl-CoA transferase
MDRCVMAGPQPGAVHPPTSDGSAADPSRGALDGIRVLELGQLIAGPYCGQILGDFGAEVVKLEQPGTGDPMRSWGVVVDGRSLSWAVIARNKRSITADLRSEQGRALALALAEQADVLVENFRPGTLERLGLGWDELHERNPRLVLVRISGFGQDGPYAGRAGFGSIGEAMGGLRHLTGDPDRPPSRVGVSLGDMLAGMNGALGALMALHARTATGLGQVVDVSLVESVLGITEALVAEYTATGRVRERTGSTLPGIAPSNVYPTADGSWILIAANQDRVFGRLAAAMGRPELGEDPDYADHEARGRNQHALDEIVAGWTATLPEPELFDQLEHHGVPAGSIYTAADIVADPHLRHRRSIIEVPDPLLGSVTMQNVVPQLSATPGRVRRPAPLLDQDAADVLSGVTARERR